MASRANVPPFHVMDLLARANERMRTHGDLINLAAGQPSTPAPHAVRQAAVRAMEEDSSDTPRRSESPSCGRRSATTTSASTGCTSPPTTSW